MPRSSSVAPDGAVEGSPELCVHADPDVAPYGQRCGSREDLAAQQVLIYAWSTVMVECSFIGAASMSEAEADLEAIKRGHAAWSQLRPYVLKHPECTFVLAHFSNRYTDDQIVEHFGEQEFPPNVILWLDSGIKVSSE